MKIKIEYEIELTEAQAKTISQLARVPLERLPQWLQGYMKSAALQRLVPWIGPDLAEVLRKEIMG